MSDTRLEFPLWTVYGRCPLVAAGVDKVVFLAELISLRWAAGPVLVLQQKIQI